MYKKRAYNSIYTVIGSFFIHKKRAYNSIYTVADFVNKYLILKGYYLIWQP